MTSVADFQARARARVAQPAGNTPEITMDDTPSLPENEGNYGSDDEAAGNDANTTRREDLAIDEAARRTVTNTVRREDLTDVARLIQRYNLPEGIMSDVQVFQRSPPSVQMIHIFLALQEIRSFITTLPRPDEWWRITASFEKNVKTYTKALFVQATVKDYQSDTIIGYMEKIIKHLRWGLPPNAEKNPDLWKTIVELIRGAASDFRSDWKKTIIASIKTKIHITELASGLTSSIDQFKPDGPFFIRIAVLRSVCARENGNAYWPRVAKELEEIRNCENPKQILVEYLLDDQGTYPRRDADTAPVNADFTSTRSDNSIVQAAGQLMGSRV